MLTESFINPKDHSAFLGSNFVNRQEEIILRIGSRQWTRTQLAQSVGIANIAAAGKLSSVLRKAKVSNIEQLFAIDPRELSLIRGLGETTVYVAMAVLATEGFDVRHWYQQVEGARRKAVTFRTMKLRRRDARRRR